MLVKDLLNWRMLEESEREEVKTKLKLVGAFALGVGATVGAVVIGKKVTDKVYSEYAFESHLTEDGKTVISVIPSTKRDKTLDHAGYFMSFDKTDDAIYQLQSHIDFLKEAQKAMDAEQFNDAITEALD